MISIAQIRAARALLNWNQEVMAKAAGISKPAIANIERGKVMPRVETLQVIQKTLENAGIEFTDGSGVRLRGEILEVQIFDGNNAIFRLWEDMQQTLSHGGVRLISGVDERIFDKVAGKERFRQVLEKFAKTGITSRILALHGDQYFVEPVSHYRWVSKALFSQVPYFIYADKYAILLTEPQQRVVLIENATIADSYRKQFNAIWDQASVPGIN